MPNVTESGEKSPKKLRMRYKIKSDLVGGYWTNRMVGAMMDAEKAAAKMIVECNQMTESLATPQYGFKKGLQIFGNEGYNTTVKKLKDNLIGRVCVKMLKKHEVSEEVKNKALGYLMFIKRKCCGKVEARGCCNGRPQRLYISKEESSSPTVATHALMASCLMEAMERRKVVTIDLPGAFLQADWPADNKCYIKFEGVIVDMILKINPEYQECVRENYKGKKFIYGRVSKAIYGTLLGSKLFFEKLTNQLKKWGFEPNSYDECTWNTTVEGEQLLCQFQVDDLKLSHVN